MEKRFLLSLKHPECPPVFRDSNTQPPIRRAFSAAIFFMHPYLLFLLLFVCLSCCLAAQDRPFDGYWTGYLTQDKGGFRPKYYFELNLGQRGNVVTGTSYSSVEKIYVEMQVKGSANGDELVVNEEKILRYTRLEDMAWCFKRCELKLSKKSGVWRLEGTWSGNSPFGPCIPGKVFLVKTVPKV